MRPALRFGFAVLAIVAFACASQRPPEPRQARSPNRFIYVSAQNLPGQCYSDLGGLQFDEPFTDAAIDPDGTQAAKRLRALALDRYPNSADAVVNVRTRQNDIGTTVTVMGEAVELVNHDTVGCVARDMPGVIDNTAKLAAGGIVGTLAGGLITNRVEGTMAGAGIGVAGAASYELAQKQEREQRETVALKNQLANQRRQIIHLQAERARLHECQEQEIALADCSLDQAPAAQDNAQDNAHQAVAVRDNSAQAAPSRNGAAQDDTAAQDGVAQADIQSTGGAQDNGGALNNNIAEPAQFNATPFEIRRQIQEQRLYIGELQQKVAEQRRQMGGY
ncbi:MAG: hypothetical protein ACREQN_13310 [Candidatus Binataceae bacterium]